MNRPEGISESAWEKAIEATNAIADEKPLGNRRAAIIAAAIQSSVEAERSRAAGEVETLIESLNEGLMTDGDLSKADVVAMKHQLEALHLAVDAIRKGA